MSKSRGLSVSFLDAGIDIDATMSAVFRRPCRDSHFYARRIKLDRRSAGDRPGNQSRPKARVSFMAATAWLSSVGGLSYSSLAAAFGASRRINSSAGLRRLLHLAASVPLQASHFAFRAKMVLSSQYSLHVRIRRQSRRYLQTSAAPLNRAEARNFAQPQDHRLDSSQEGVPPLDFHRKTSRSKSPRQRRSFTAARKFAAIFPCISR